MVEGAGRGAEGLCEGDRERADYGRHRGEFSEVVAPEALQVQKRAA